MPRRLDPEKVAKGVREFIAWEYKALADVRARECNTHTALYVTVRDFLSEAKLKKLERDFGDLVPPGYKITVYYPQVHAAH